MRFFYDFRVLFIQIFAVFLQCTIVYSKNMCYLCNRKPQCTMNRRLQKFLDAENVSQSQFADSINVARASVSHIIAGRNKPGFDFVEKMARAYPMLNVEWLITGKGKMYKDNSATASTSPLPVMDDDLFAQYDEPDMKPEPSPKHPK